MISQHSGATFPAETKDRAQAVPQILTANRLADGEVVYWASGRWVERMDAAALLPDGKDAEQAALAEAAQWVARRVVVNPYLFAVRVENGTVRPVKIRETIRAAGPTTRTDLGKQARAIG